MDQNEPLKGTEMNRNVPTRGPVNKDQPKWREPRHQNQPNEVKLTIQRN